MAGSGAPLIGTAGTLGQLAILLGATATAAVLVCYTDGLTSYAGSGWAWAVLLLARTPPAVFCSPPPAQRGSLSCSSGSSPNSSAAGGLRRPRTGALLPVVDSRGTAMRFEGLRQVARAALARRLLLAVDAAFGRSVSNGRWLLAECCAATGSALVRIIRRLSVAPGVAGTHGARRPGRAEIASRMPTRAIRPPRLQRPERPGATRWRHPADSK